ncbi:hypothetical protein VCR14J2_410146 [Vibrio coralliirubri]|nr:hypothetical protein VCR14J2_410146 [Vibrio coralliirubri]
MLLCHRADNHCRCKNRKGNSKYHFLLDTQRVSFKHIWTFKKNHSLLVYPEQDFLSALQQAMHNLSDVSATTNKTKDFSLKNLQTRCNNQKYSP